MNFIHFTYSFKQCDGHIGAFDRNGFEAVACVSYLCGILQGSQQGEASNSFVQREISEQYVSHHNPAFPDAHEPSSLRLRSNSSIARQRRSSSDDDKLQLDRCAKPQVHRCAICYQEGFVGCFFPRSIVSIWHAASSTSSTYAAMKSICQQLGCGEMTFAASLQAAAAAAGAAACSAAGHISGEPCRCTAECGEHHP